LINREKKRKQEKTWFPRIHHILTMQYRWIPYEEFKSLPLPMFWQLFEQLEEQKKYEKEEMDKVRRR